METQEVKYTAKQKAVIRAHYAYMPLRFRKDGSVEGKKGGSWGVLYSHQDMVKHLEAVGLSK